MLIKPLRTPNYNTFKAEAYFILIRNKTHLTQNSKFKYFLFFVFSQHYSFNYDVCCHNCVIDPYTDVGTWMQVVRLSAHYGAGLVLARPSGPKSKASLSTYSSNRLVVTLTILWLYYTFTTINVKSYCHGKTWLGSKNYSAVLQTDLLVCEVKNSP